MPATRWGIASAGKISFDFVNSLTTVDNKADHQVVAVAARGQEGADKFAAQFDIPKAYAGYDKLASDPNVEVVYVGAVNPAHLDIVRMMLNAGKHVLCEKPVGMNVKETKEMVALAREKGLFFMEAMWSWFLPAHKKLREELHEKKAIGDVIQLEASFGRNIAAPRISRKDLGGGVTLDLGVYCTYLTMLVFDKVRPDKIVAHGRLNSEGTDASLSAVMTFPNGGTSTVTAHAGVNLDCEARVYGSGGKLSLPGLFHCADAFVDKEGKRFEFPLKPGRYEFNFDNSAGLAFEAQHVRECLEKGLKESPVVTLDDCLLAAEIMEAMRKQVGVVYPQDE